MAIAPVSLEGKVRNLRRCVPRRCGRSPHGGRGRWSASARGCSLDSTQSCSGCSPAPGWPRIGGLRSWPWWRRGSCRSAGAWVTRFNTDPTQTRVLAELGFKCMVRKLQKLERKAGLLLTCRNCQDPAVGMSLCSTRFAWESHPWPSPCVSQGSPDWTLSLPAKDIPHI